MGWIWEVRVKEDSFSVFHLILFPGMGKLRGKQVLGEIDLDMLSLIYILAIEKEMSSVQVQNGVWGRVRVGNINVDVISI